MKFKIIILFFNLVVAIFFMAIFTLPSSLPGENMVHEFLAAAWPLLAALFLVTLGIDLFFAFNFRLYSLLERQDWIAVTRYLEQRVLEKGRFGSRLTGLLAHVYIVRSDYSSLGCLEERLAREKPALLEEYALLFGAGRILGEDYHGAALFFAARPGADPAKKLFVRRVPGRNSGTGAWLLFYRGLSLFLSGRTTDAMEIFIVLARCSLEPLTGGLSAWFLARTLLSFPPAEDAEFAAAAEKGRERASTRYRNRAAWDKAAARQNGEIHISILSKYLRDAADWIYASPGEHNAQL